MVRKCRFFSKFDHFALQNFTDIEQKANEFDTERLKMREEPKQATDDSSQSTPSLSSKFLMQEVERKQVWNLLQNINYIFHESKKKILNEAARAKDPKKSAQADRLGLGVIGAQNNRSGAVHSIQGGIRTIQQEDMGANKSFMDRKSHRDRDLDADWEVIDEERSEKAKMQ